MVSKKEFYNMVVDLYLKTGQGAPGFIKERIDTNVIDELINEGKLKIIKERFSYFPDEEWICLTGVYCVEEESAKKNHRALDFIRRYLNIPRTSPIDKKLDEFFENNPIEKQKYDKEYEDWLNENRDIIEQSFKIQKMEI